jgi:D-alanyl-D-alanine carboxypeptidase
LLSTLSCCLADKKAAIVVDYTNNESVLFSQNPDAKRYPASLTKIMTVYLLFEAIKKKKISLKTKFEVSKLATQQIPSKLWLKHGDKISVKDLIRALLVKSANDAAITAAEGLAGSVKNFCKLMNKKSKKLGMKNTYFATPAGVPHPKQISTARDLVKLGIAIYKTFPQYWYFFSEKEFSYNGKKHATHSKILLWYKGADGAKTGYTCISGFNLFVTATKYDDKGRKRRVFVVVMGEQSGKIRDMYAAKLMNLYLKDFDVVNKSKTDDKKAKKSLLSQIDKPESPESIVQEDEEILLSDITKISNVSKKYLNDLYEIDEDVLEIAEEFPVTSKTNNEQ